MPNNNPTGHNQYTKRKEQNQRNSGAPMNAALNDSQASDSSNSDSDYVSLTTSTPPTPAKRGFAAMDEATQRGIASKGGQSQGKENNPGNFANDRDRAREAGRKGGESHGTHRTLS